MNALDFEPLPIIVFRKNLAQNMDFQNPRLILETSEMENGSVAWRSPSNIALIKYWGKHGQQLPRNPSLSFTLTNSFTETEVEWSPKSNDDGQIALRFFFENAENETFSAKTRSFLSSLEPIFPFLRQLDLTIRTSNSFPHSAGIASSASAMSALALCLCSMEDRFLGTLSDSNLFDQKASFLARLGSGSASRSIFSKASVWGKTLSIEGSSDEFAVGAEHLLAPVFHDFHDDILLVSKAEKSVSSRAGHALMEGNPFAEARYFQARQRFESLLLVLKNGDLEAFGQICEDEALTLHALMMASNPSFLLLRPASLAIIEKVRAYRKRTGQPVFFTIDAGPNIHLLYPESIIHDVRMFIAQELAEHCENAEIIDDFIGEGPEEL